MLERDAYVGRVHYHLAIYQHFSEQEGEPVPAAVEIEGHVTALDALSITDLHRAQGELTLTLRLADGRILEFVTRARS